MCQCCGRAAGRTVPVNSRRLKFRCCSGIEAGAQVHRHARRLAHMTPGSLIRVVRHAVAASVQWSTAEPSHANGLQIRNQQAKHLGDIQKAYVINGKVNPAATHSTAAATRQKLHLPPAVVTYQSLLNDKQPFDKQCLRYMPGCKASWRLHARAHAHTHTHTHTHTQVSDLNAALCRMAMKANNGC